MALPRASMQRSEESSDASDFASNHGKLDYASKLSPPSLRASMLRERRNDVNVPPVTLIA